MDPRTRNLKRQYFGALEVIDFAGYHNFKARWICLCHLCNQTCTMYASNITRNVACGCQRHEGRNRSHGMKNTAEYKCWVEMKRRCAGKSPRSIRYKQNGIIVCKGLADDFQWFFSILGERPAGMSIERIKNAGDDPKLFSYTCGGCGDCRTRGMPLNITWATKKEQARNRRSNRLLTIDGKTMCVAAWAEETGVDPLLIPQRIDRLGWNEKDAVYTPPHGIRSSV